MTKSAFTNVAACLPEMAHRQPDMPAIIFSGGTSSLSFSELDTLSDRIAHGLVHAGIGPGVRAVVMVTPGTGLFALTFALLKAGAVPVMIDPGLGVQKLGRSLSQAKPTAFIGIPKAHAARILFGWCRSTLRIFITVGRRLPGGGATLNEVTRRGSDGPFPLAVTTPEDLAAILFTSGSTGAPKGVRFSQGNFSAQVEALRQLYGFQPGEIDLPTFAPLALFAPALGMTAVIPDMDFTRPGSVDPRIIVSAVSRHNVTNMFGSPALIDRVGRFGAAKGIRLPTLRRVISAGAPVSAATLQRFSRMLAEGVEIFSTYGATESLPVCFVGSREILEETRHITEKGGGVCVGRPAQGMRVEVIRISDEPIGLWCDTLKVTQGEVGEIVVQGPQVTRAYCGAPEADELAKIADPAGGFFHRMGDLGRMDPSGRLWFYGRKSQRVETARGILFTVSTEAVFNTHPAVCRSALVGIGPRGSQRPVICIELERGTSIRRKRLRAELLAIGARCPCSKEIFTILFHPAFPVDIRHNAKIFREKLAAWAERKLA